MDMMRDEYGEMKLRLAEKAVSETFWMDTQDIWKKSRKRQFVDARGFVFYILRKRYGFTFTRIASLCGYNHATVIYHCEGLEARTGCVREYKMQYKAVIKKLKILEKTENN